MRLSFVSTAAVLPLPAWAQARGELTAGEAVLLLALLLVLALLWGLRLRRRVAALTAQRADLSGQLQDHRAQEQRRRQAQAIAEHMQLAASPEELGQRLLAGLAPILGLGAGLLARWDAERAELQPLARWAGEGAELQAASASSLGLLADCARQGQALVLNGSQAGSLRIQSGLGWMHPHTLVLQPVRQGGLVHAVLELGSTRAWQPHDHQLLADLEPLIALSLGLQTRVQRGLQGGADQHDQWLLDAPCALTALNAAGQLQFANPAFEQLIGLEPGQPLPGHLRSSWVDLEQLQDFLHKATEQAELRAYPAQLLRQDGRRVQVRIDARWSVHEGRRSLIAHYHTD